MYVGLRINNRSNYQCLFCTHKAWKSESYGIAHIDSKHPKERADLLAKKLQEAQNKPPRIEYREKVAYKNRPEPEYQDKQVNVFCDECRVVMTNVRLPKSHTIHTTSCNYCGTTSLKIVHKVT